MLEFEIEYSSSNDYYFYYLVITVLSLYPDLLISKLAYLRKCRSRAGLGKL